MQRVTEAGSTSNTASTNTGDASIKKSSSSQTHIDAASQAARTPAITGTSAPATTLSVRLGSQSEKRLSYSDRIRHDSLVKGSQSTCLHLANLPVTLREIDLQVVRGHVSLLQRHLDEGRVGDAVDLFGALGKELCAPQLQTQGLHLWQQVLGHMGEDSSVPAGIAWLHAARLHDAADEPQPALHAYGRALGILQPLGTASLKHVQERQRQLQSFETTLVEARQVLEHKDPHGAEKLLTNRALTLPRTLRREIQCLHLAGDIATARGSFQMAVHYYQAAANRASSKPEKFKAEADEAIAKRDGLRSKLDAQTVNAVAAACRDSQPTLDQLLLNAARHLQSEDCDAAARMFDDLIPRLLRRDVSSALSALLDRRNISVDVEDGQTARINLELVPVFVQLGESANAAFCLSNVLIDEEVMNWLPKSVKAAGALFEMHGMAGAVQWCEAASKRQLKDGDAQTLEGHIGNVLTMVADGAAGQAARGTFDPLLKYAKDLVDNGIADEVPNVFKAVLHAHKNIDAHSLEAALDDHLKGVAMWDDRNAISVGLRLAMADLEIEKQDLRSAARDLRRALELDLSSGSLLGECLDCAGRIAAAAGETRNAIYFVEAARLCDTGDEATDRRDDDKERAQELAAQLETKLLPEEVEAARNDANRWEPDSPEVQAAMVELIERVIGAVASQA
jgi:hypothetical protein